MVCRLNKRAVGTGFLAAIILVVVVIFLLLVLAGNKIIPFLYHGSEEEICEQSVVARANTIKKGLGMQVDLGLIKELKCKTIYYEIRDDGVYRYQDEQANLVYAITDEKNRDVVIKQTLADAMTSCWRVMGQGEYELWGGTEEKVHCIICSEISFDMKKPPETISDFGLYLKNTPMSIKEGASTYAEYFSFGTDQLGDYQINPGVPIDVIYVQTDHQGKLGEFLSDAKGGCKKGATGGLLSRIPVVGDPLATINKIMTPGGFLSDCLIGAIGKPIMSHIFTEEEIQPMLFVLPATEFDASKCDATY